MYYLIGADGKVNGPMSAADIHQWLAEGRASRYSRVRREEDPTWQSLASFPELVPPRAEPAPEAPERPVAETAQTLAASFPARGTTLDAGRCVSRAGALVRDNPVILIGSALVTWSLIVGISLIPRVGWMIGMVLNSPLLGGLYYVYLRRLRGLPSRAEDVFAGFRLAFLPLVLAGLLSGALTSLGFLLLIVPGIYLAIAFMFVVPLVIDKRLEPWVALEVSRRVVHGQWWTMLALGLIASLIAAVGVLAFGVGVLIAVPVATATLAYAYEDLFGDGGPTSPS
jgi:uncharacterized membrane protein